MKRMVLLLLFILCTVWDLYADSTGVRTAFTRGGLAGAHNIAMGGAVEATTDDLFAIYWNPAGLTNLRRKKISIRDDVRLKLKQDEIDRIRERDLELFLENTPKFFIQVGISATLLDEEREASFAGVAFNVFDFVLGVGAYAINSDEIETYDEEGTSTGVTAYRTGAGYFSIAYPTEFVSLGVTTKVLYEDLDETPYGGLGWDVGIQTDFIPLLQLGVVVQDLGTGLMPINEEEEYSNDYVFTRPLLRFNLALASRTSDFVLSLGVNRKFESEDLEYKLGFEYRLTPDFSAYLGVKSTLFSTGLQANILNVDVSYALSVDNIDYGYNHTVSALFLF